jgi:hypothetical protein
VLASHLWGALRARRVAELADLKSADEAADWVHRNLPTKNTLTLADAETVEANFRERLAAIEEGQVDFRISEAVGNPSSEHQKQRRAVDGPKTSAPAAKVVRRRLAAKTIRLRDKEHCKFVATRACVICGRTPAEAAPRSLCSAACAQPQGQRRVHGPSLPPLPSRAA